eukprot:TRINITY_DN16097_c0_g1_i2.p1 TRINITY_DN16097_c0_g1~~TRINITY_DN16097_c0_g1_i2.p1  ORF type:complete len:310 (-),score=103.14 TRINITY_DN16097_c0_g1_i2:36-965(-)
MMSTSGSGTLDEVAIRKYVTLSIKDHIEKLQEAQDRLRNETAAQLQEFSTTLTKLESALQQASSTIKRTQESCKYVNKEMEMLKAKEKAAAELQAETISQKIEHTIKISCEAAEKEMQQMTNAHNLAQQALHQASARASQELEALQQEMQVQKLSGALFSLRVAKLTEQRRVEMIRDLEQQQVGLPTQFDKIIASPAPSATPSEAATSRAEPQQASSSRDPAPGPSQLSLQVQDLVEKHEASGTKMMQSTADLQVRMDKLEINVELQQLAANIFCLRMMDAESPVRESCIKKLEQKHRDLAEGQRVERL